MNNKYLFLLQWLIINVFGIVIGLNIVDNLVKTTGFFVGFSLSGVFTGVLLSILQYFVLKRKIQDINSWIPLNIIGWLLAYVIGWSTGFGVGWGVGISQGWRLGHGIAVSVGGFIGGFILGLFQYLSLKKGSYNLDPSWIIIASSFSFTVSYFLSWYFEFLTISGMVGNLLEFAQDGILTGTLVGSITALFSGIVIILMLHDPNNIQNDSILVRDNRRNDDQEYQYSLEQKLTILSTIFAIVGVLIALLTWLFPLNPIGNSPFK